MRPNIALGIGMLLVAGCGEAEPASPPPSTAEPPPAESGSTGGAPHALPADVRAEIDLPGPTRRHASVSVALGALPWAIVGCTMPEAGPCEETSRVELDEATRTQLVTLIEEVRAMPRCEPDPIVPDDRPFELTLTGMGTYRAALPGDPALAAERNAGECRAPARLVWLLVERFAPPESLPMPPAVES